LHCCCAEVYIQISFNLVIRVRSFLKHTLKRDTSWATAWRNEEMLMNPSPGDYGAVQPLFCSLLCIGNAATWKFVYTVDFKRGVAEGGRHLPVEPDCSAKAQVGALD